MGLIYFFCLCQFYLFTLHASLPLIFVSARGCYRILKWAFKPHSISAVTEGELIRFLDFSTDYCVKTPLYFDPVVIDKCN